MASQSLQSIQHHGYHRRHHPTTHNGRRRASFDSPPQTRSSTLFPKSPTTSTNTISTAAHSRITVSLAASPATTTASTAAEPITFSLLQHHLSAQNFREADEETRRLLILLAGEAAKKRGYVFFSEVQFISKDDLTAIDELWRKYSNGRFGYSVQKRIWQKVNKDFTRFFLKVEWMKKLEGSEIEQYNYRSFPEEFIWEMKEDTPEGHLPLTNALRGTQLLNSILSHPAFEDINGETDGGKDTIDDDGLDGLKGTSQSERLFKPNYSF
ncbi:hypothetical protein Nepgr_029070 [Nepenthes gracilis]|uniref:GUN4-like domain-containing protein n=1 Tax=Nepenthes gracilis TaxID=150966 RepID=A0AAD3TES1_NEPGR|nr:hypothetical protein Nepgr_029070 [Nepenthes gracilis]